MHSCLKAKVGTTVKEMKHLLARSLNLAQAECGDVDFLNSLSEG